MRKSEAAAFLCRQKFWQRGGGFSYLYKECEEVNEARTDRVGKTGRLCI